MRVLGIDPGYDRCGVAIVEQSNNSSVLVYSSCLSTEKDEPFEDRLVKIQDGISEIIEKYKPEAGALETILFSKNRKTALSVAEVRGAIRIVLAQNDIPTLELSPSEIKLAVTGDGTADKQQIYAMLKMRVPELPKNALDDEYDAIAVALAHYKNRS